VRSGGFTFVEVGGDQARFDCWLGGAELPIRFAGSKPGLRAVGIKASDLCASNRLRVRRRLEQRREYRFDQVRARLGKRRT
jgi:hypothetical protein